MTEQNARVGLTGETVVIAIVSRGKPKDILLCLGSLEYSTARDYEVRIVGNTGPDAFDRTVRQVHARPDCEVRSID